MRLSDARLAWMENDVHGGYVTAGRLSASDVRALISELRERRAQDLNFDEIQTLRDLRAEIIEFGMADDDGQESRPNAARALSVLDRLLDRGAGR